MSAFIEFFAEAPALAAVAIVGLIAALYLARVQMHVALKAAFEAASRALRLAAKGLQRVRTQLDARNREVLLAAGRETAERQLSREFERVAETVRRDLGGYPKLNQSLSEIARALETDYAKAVEAPPSPPGWSDAVAAVANIEARSEPVIRDVLESIHGSFEAAHQEAADEYRTDCKERHRRLSDMAPRWRAVQNGLGEAQSRMEAVLSRAGVIDQHIERYEAICADKDEAVRSLQSSAFVQFLIAGLVLVIAAGGAVINFHLIARPMAEMVGGTSMIGGMRTADIAALVIILMELAMGLFLMDCLKITRLFPLVGALPDKIRFRMGVIAFSLLTALAAIEAGLAYMREILVRDSLATAALLRGEAEIVASTEFLWITTATQMGMGFILPYALAFAAIPLESFIQSLRAVLGWTLSSTLAVSALVLRVSAIAMKGLGEIAVRAYDIAIFAPLWLERRVKGAGKTASPSKDDPVGARAVMADIETRIAS